MNALDLLELVSLCGIVVVGLRLRQLFTRASVKPKTRQMQRVEDATKELQDVYHSLMEILEETSK